MTILNETRQCYTTKKKKKKKQNLQATKLRIDNSLKSMHCIGQNLKFLTYL